MHFHCVVVAESFATIRALPRAVGQAVLYAKVAKDVSARLDNSVLDFSFADLALDHRLHHCSL